MPSRIVSLALFCLSHLNVCNAVPSYSSQGDNDFSNPPAIARPKFRYWLPDASVDPAVVKEDIESAGSIGAGGVEFLPFYNYGGTRDPPPAGSDWSTYNFGTPPFQRLFRAALEAHRENGLKMDFAVGANQGQGVPASEDDEGLQWDLVPFSAPVASDGVFNGTLPGWGTGELVAAVSGVVVSERNVSTSPRAPPVLRIVLRHGTLTDISDRVSVSNGMISTQLPPANSTETYRLFCFYQRHTLNRNIVDANDTTGTIFDNGSYTVDHFSPQGALTVTQFWEDHILTDGVRELLSEAGDCSWEDSMEVLSNISWTPSLLSRFESKLGYDLKPFLPLIAYGNNNINLQGGSPGAFQAVLDTEDQGSGYVNDYRIALADGYQAYLSTLGNWTQSYLGLRHSAQVSYNLPMDMEASIPFVEVPECESLQFRNSVDGYRQFSGVAYLAGKNVVSVELGAVFGLAFRYTVPDLLFSTHRAVSGGVNRIVIHGQSYTGNYTATTWPGYTAFNYGVSDSYMNKQPTWDHGLGSALEHIARTQYIQQSGSGKFDLAIYNRQSATDPVVHTLYTADDLSSSGWSYTYLTPENFKLSEAYVSDSVLAPEGPAFKAMIVPSTQNMTIEAVTDLQKYAQSSLPVILLGGDPGYYPSGEEKDKAAVDRAISELKNTANVYSVANGGLVPQLHELGLTPRISIQTNGTWWTTWREDADAGIDYAFVFCDTETSSGEISVASTKKPYIFDSWTGTRTPLLQYTQDDNSTIIPLKLAGNQTVTIAFTDIALDGVDVPPFHILQSPSEVLGSSYDNSSGLVLQVSSSTQPGTVTLSSGKRVALNVTEVPAEFELKNWTLTAEHWEAPSNMYDVSVVAVKRNTTHSLDTLVSWTKIPGLANASGLGYYENTFNWPPSSGNTSDEEDLGAYLDFSSILNAITLFVNGEQTPPLDYSNPVIDISPYLTAGANHVTAVVPTTMLNYLRSISAELENTGQSPSVSGSTDNGLVNPVTVVPFRKVVVAE